MNTAFEESFSNFTKTAEIFHELYLMNFSSGSTAIAVPQQQYPAGVAQLVERNLAKVEVASSRLVSRSKYKKEASANTALPFFLQVLAQWQSGHAADCKSVYVGSIPACASSIFKARSDAGLFVFWRGTVEPPGLSQLVTHPYALTIK